MPDRPTSVGPIAGWPLALASNVEFLQVWMNSMLQPATTTIPPEAEAAEGRRSRRRRELHQSILATAAELFARDGYDATTVEKIADAADIVPATFFNHFRSKEDVLREVGQDVFSRFRRLVDEQIDRDVTSSERLRGFAARSAELVRRAPEMTRRVLVAVLRSSRPGESGAELASMHADFVRLLERGQRAAPQNVQVDAQPNVQADMQRDVPHDLDIDLAAEILVSVVIGAMTHWINDPAYPLETRLGQSLSLLASRLLEEPVGARVAVKHSSRKPTIATSRARKTGAAANPGKKRKKL
jgi:AcrR family transcriptional regulator